MATSVEEYYQAGELIAKGIDLSTGTYKVALVDSNYTFDATDTQWADASGDEISGTNYTTGGETLSGLSVTQSTGTTKWDATDVTWSNATLTCRRAIIYYSGSFDSKTNPLLFAILFDDTPADVSVTGTDFKVIWHDDGLISIG